MSLTLIIVIWYLIGFVSLFIFIYKIRNIITVEDLISIAVFAVWGPAWYILYLVSLFIVKYGDRTIGSSKFFKKVLFDESFFKRVLNRKN